MKTNKFVAFFDALGAFLRWTWKYPTTPKENFQDARFRYNMNIDPEMKKLWEEFDKAIEEHNEQELRN